MKFNTQLEELNFNNPEKSGNINNINYNYYSIKLLNNIFNSKNIIELKQELNITTEIETLKKEFEEKFNYLLKKEDLEGKKELTKDFYNFIRNNRKYFEQSLFNKTIFEKNITNKSYFETNQINAIDESDYVIRLQNNNFPLKLIKGILNKKNISNLKNNNIQNNIFFNYKISKKNISSKVYHCEQF
jgi:hypothetical protein